MIKDKSIEKVDIRISKVAEVDIFLNGRSFRFQLLHTYVESQYRAFLNNFGDLGELYISVLEAHGFRHSEE